MARQTLKEVSRFVGVSLCIGDGALKALGTFRFGLKGSIQGMALWPHSAIDLLGSYLRTPLGPGHLPTSLANLPLPRRASCRPVLEHVDDSASMRRRPWPLCR